MNYHLFSAFLLITFVLVIVPGPIVTLIIATGATRGVGAALLTTAGSTLGNALLLACIALGLNWILKTSSEVFEVMRWIGAAYLVWLGIQSWRHAGGNGGAVSPRGHVYLWRGFAVAITNPKTIAFFTAFLPQFVDPNLPVGYQLAVMCPPRRAGRDTRLFPPRSAEFALQRKPPERAVQSNTAGRVRTNEPYRSIQL
jgi:homoserine/homoserine lactone efflux protein